MRSGRDCGHDILMPGHRLSREAVADIEAIGDYGIETFGLTQALKYHVGLESRFELLSEFPRIGSPCYDLRPGLYRWPYKSHAIFYTIGSGHILIVRILHARVDFARHF
jgi:toxin ParE1/3/4